jgi:hypothetical protein
MKHLKRFNEINEGRTEKAYKSKDHDVKKEFLEIKIENFLKVKKL